MGNPKSLKGPTSDAKSQKHETPPVGEADARRLGAHDIASFTATLKIIEDLEREINQERSAASDVPELSGSDFTGPDDERLSLCPDTRAITKIKDQELSTAEADSDVEAKAKNTGDQTKKKQSSDSTGGFNEDWHSSLIVKARTAGKTGHQKHSAMKAKFDVEPQATKSMPGTSADMGVDNRPGTELSDFLKPKRKDRY